MTNTGRGFTQRRKDSKEGAKKTSTSLLSLRLCVKPTDLALRASRAIIAGFRPAQIFVCMPEEAIQVKGARVNNLKNVSFSVPINQMTVVTGVSGSGKS